MLIVVEGPEADERSGLLSGVRGRIFWPLLQRFAGIGRHSADVIGGSAFDGMLAMGSFGTTDIIVTVGATASKAVLGDQWTSMQVCNGMSYTVGRTRVVPVWPISVAGSVDGKDPLAWLSAGLKGVKEPRFPKSLIIPDWEEYNGSIFTGTDMVIGIDTEGTPSDPQCLTYASRDRRVFVEPEDVSSFWKFLESLRIEVVYHNAPWDWAVLQAMGVNNPWKVPYIDTMEKAYLRQTEPQGLKDLGKRHFNLDMVSWEGTVMPWYRAIVGGLVEGRVAAGTVTTTHSPKTGKKYKFPKIERAPEIKRLAKLTDIHKKAAAIEFEAPSLRHVPFDIMVEYATLDPFVTLALAEVL